MARLELFLLERRQGHGAQAKEELRAFAGQLRWPRLARAAGARVPGRRFPTARWSRLPPTRTSTARRRITSGRLHADDDPALARKQLLEASAEDCDQADFARQELEALQSR